jgi:HlyD family secretion protein
MDTLTLDGPLAAPRQAAPANSPNSQRETGQGAPSGWTAQGVTIAFLSAVACGLAAAALTVALSGRQRAAAARYRTETVSRGAVTGLLRLPAQVVPTAQVRVGPEHPGRVLSVGVRIGDRVHKGDVLARLDSRQLRAAVVGAEAGLLAAQVGARQAQLRLAQVVYLLQQTLRGHTSSSEEGEEKPTEILESAALDAEANLANAAAELHRQAAAGVASRATLEAATLRAPIDGVVVSRNVEPDETVQAGDPLFVVAADPARVELLAPVGELDAAGLRAGRATFEVPAHPGRRFATTLAVLEPTTTSAGSPYRLRLHAENAERTLQPGMTATVEVVGTSSVESLVVPTAALAFSPGGAASEPGPSVYVVGEGGPRRIPVQVGVTDGRNVEVRGALLQPGTEVIVGAR